MTFLEVANNAASTLAGTINSSVTTLDVATGEGDLFPSAFPFHISIGAEILAVTDRTDDEFTVTRAQQGTSAAGHTSGSAVELRVTAKSISDLNTAVTSLTDTVNGMSGPSGIADPLTLVERVSTPTPVADAFVLFTRDNAGKTQLCAVAPNGTVYILITG